MYHFELSRGESPGSATVNEAPLESYVGLPCGVKESEGPAEKSTVTALPKAGFAGQLPEEKEIITTCFDDYQFFPSHPDYVRD
ncbi:MAG: hypothetical protein Q9184_004116 [Pyrenodesmia sp. 2 TL-2023]